MYTVILYYKYIHIDDPESFAASQRVLCQKLGLKGRLLIAHEGINGTLEGTTENIETYIAETSKDPRFSDIHWKKSEGTGHAFPKLKVKVRPEIVTAMLGDEDIDPTKVTGKYISAEELHGWIHSGTKEFYIVDMRNDFEQKVGYFENSLFPGMSHFRDLKSTLPRLSHLKNKTIVTVCTGGVRCEKASGFLVANGFTDVYQLQGGIVTYMEKYPNLDFKGKLYVFDERIIMGFNSQEAPAEVVGKCLLCSKKSEHYVNCKNPDCNLHFILCEECSKNGRRYCVDCSPRFNSI